MKQKSFELLQAGEMRKQFALFAENRPSIRLNPENVPQKLRHLIPYAESWGISDDLIRENLINKSSGAAIKELKEIVEAHDDLLDEWLAGPEAGKQTVSPEYIAFSCMRMAADFS